MNIYLTVLSDGVNKILHSIQALWKFLFEFIYLASPDDLVFRSASSADKRTILSLRKNVYNGLDYLADYFDSYISDPNRQCIVGEVDGQLVSFSGNRHF